MNTFEMWILSKIDGIQEMYYSKNKIVKIK